MKLRSTDQRGSKARTRAFVVAVTFAVVGALPSGCTSGRVSSSSSTQQPESSTRAAASTKDAREAHPPACPFLSPPGLIAARQVKGSHTVILSWTASASDSKHADAVGYCIYRTTGRKDAPAERVNSIPLPVTSCVDDVVEDGQKYYYLVRAISAKGVTSVSSKTVPARIPTGKPGNPAQSAVPFCWDPAGRK
ncbi:MAG: fibronectin type III domain-containing protein [Candidatus Sulfotelmatobacter sp.]